MKLLIIFALLLATGCEQIRLEPIENPLRNFSKRSAPIPAVRDAPDIDSNVALSVAISQALNNTTVSLSKDALTDTNLLIIERNSHVSINGRVATGRMMERPERFQLFLENDACVLAHENTGMRYPLADTTCVELR